MAIVQPAQKTKNWLLLWFNLNTTYLPRIDTTYSFIDKPWKSLFFQISIQYNMYLCLLFPKLHIVHQRSSQVHFFRTTKLHINYCTLWVPFVLAANKLSVYNSFFAVANFIGWKFVFKICHYMH